MTPDGEIRDPPDQDPRSNPGNFAEIPDGCRLRRNANVSCKSTYREYLRGKYHCTIDLLFDWFGISCMTTDNFCLQNRQIQTSQTGGPWYSDTSPFSIPCILHSIITEDLIAVFIKLFREVIWDKSSLFSWTSFPQRLFSEAVNLFHLCSSQLLSKLTFNLTILIIL